MFEPSLPRRLALLGRRRKLGPGSCSDQAAPAVASQLQRVARRCLADDDRPAPWRQRHRSKRTPPHRAPCRLVAGLHSVDAVLEVRPREVCLAASTRLASSARDASLARAATLYSRTRSTVSARSAQRRAMTTPSVCSTAAPPTRNPLARSASSSRCRRPPALAHDPGLRRRWLRR